jgi:Domain of unknown function (DUF4158)
MRREWNADELAEHWSLRPEEKDLLANKNGPTRLGFAVMLKFFQHEGRFPRHRQEVPPAVVKYLARHVGVAQRVWNDYNLESRATRYHRAQIREFLGFREATVEDAAIAQSAEREFCKFQAVGAIPTGGTMCVSSPAVRGSGFKSRQAKVRILPHAPFLNLSTSG